MNAFSLRLTPDLPILGDEPEVIANGWRRLLEARAKRVYPAHGPPFPALMVMWGRQTSKGWKSMEQNRATQIMAQGYV